MTSKLYRNKPSFPAFSTVFALESLVLWVAVARSATNLFFYELPDNFWENKKYKIFKTPNHQSDSMCQLPQKIQVLKRKSLKAKQFFWRQLPPKTAKFVKCGVKKPVWQPWSWMCPVSNWLCVEVSSVFMKGFERFALLFLVGGFVDRQVTAVVCSLASNVTWETFSLTLSPHLRGVTVRQLLWGPCVEARKTFVIFELPFSWRFCVV